MFKIPCGNLQNSWIKRKKVGKRYLDIPSKKITEDSQIRKLTFLHPNTLFYKGFCLFELDLLSFLERVRSGIFQSFVGYDFISVINIIISYFVFWKKISIRKVSYGMERFMLYIKEGGSEWQILKSSVHILAEKRKIRKACAKILVSRNVRNKPLTAIEGVARGLWCYVDSLKRGLWGLYISGALLWRLYTYSWKESIWLFSNIHFLKLTPWWWTMRANSHNSGNGLKNEAGGLGTFKKCNNVRESSCSSFFKWAVVLSGHCLLHLSSQPGVSMWFSIWVYCAH